MGDGKPCQFGVGQQSRAPTAGAPAGGEIDQGKAVSAEGGHDTGECRGFWALRERVYFGRKGTRALPCGDGLK